MADEGNHASQDALAVLGMLRGGRGIDMRAFPPRGRCGRLADPEQIANAREAEIERGLPRSAPRALDAALPLTLGTVGDVVGRRVMPGGGLLFGALGAGAGSALNQPVYSAFGS